MKRAYKIIIIAILIIAALWGAFYTETLTERQQRERMNQYNPEQLVEALMKDSLETLHKRAVSIEELAQGIATDHPSFATHHGSVLGIGSPIFYVVEGACNGMKLGEDGELLATVDGVQLTIPTKYIFGNTARDASGWFNIDNFKNTMEFNAVSAAMNAYIGKQLQKNHLLQIATDSMATRRISFIGAVSVPSESNQVDKLTLIPYQIK
ncbi:MAG: DUF2291 family protein [Prevotella sp.]|nr:DUF2291 family protein [Prevotella sp.]MBR1461950.1 DUF2291 family protein [Prevotella sp.]